MLVVGAYRSDGLPRDHMLRWLRNELRRGGVLDEVVLGALDQDQTAALLAELLPEAPSPSLVRAIHDRTQGSPFFVEELAGALLANGSLEDGRRGLALGERGEVPVPDTVRDAVLMGASGLSDEARAAAEVAAVAGEAFDLALVEQLSSDAGLVELLDQGLLEEEAAGRAGFRHALTREALYAEVPWMRRRALHRDLAEALEAAGGPSMEIATHWVGAGEEGRSREALVRAASESEAVHAYRDAAKAGRQALERWPEAEEAGRRVQTLERYARCAELAGELGEATKAWRELAALRSSRRRALGLRRHAAPARGRVRAARRARAGVHRAAARRRGLRERGTAGRRRRRAAGDGQPPPRRRPLRRGDRARADRRGRGDRGGPRSISGRGRWGSSASPGPRAANSRPGWRRFVPAWPWRSSTT